MCEVSLNILSCLLDLEIIERKRDVEKLSDLEKKSEDEQSMTTDSGKTEITAFDLAMDSVIRFVLLISLLLYNLGELSMKIDSDEDRQ